MSKNFKIVLSSIVLSFIVLVFGGCNESEKAVSSSRIRTVEALKPKALQIVLRGLADSDPAVRASAIEVVALGQRTDLMPQVQKLLKDDYVPVRFSAALAVGDLKYQPAKSDLEKLLKDDENVKIAAAYALDRLGALNSFEILEQAVKSKDQTVRANAAMLLGKTSDKKALETLYWVLRDEDSGFKVRFQAVEAIARLGDEEILSRLWAMALSAYADDRVMGVKGIGVLGTAKAKEVLLTKLDDEVLEVRLKVAEQLGILDDKSGEPEVLEVFTKNLTGGLKYQDQVRIKVLTAMAIGEIGSPGLVRYLPQLLEDESGFVRIAGAGAVFRCVRAN